VVKSPHSRIEEGYAIRNIRKLGGFCTSLYRDSIGFFCTCYSRTGKKLANRSGYKIALAAMPLGIGAYLASLGVEDPAISELLSATGYGSMGAGSVSFADEYLNGRGRVKEKKQMEKEMRNLEEELEGSRKQEEENEKLLKQLLKEEKKQTQILKEELVAG